MGAGDGAPSRFVKSDTELGVTDGAVWGQSLLRPCMAATGGHCQGVSGECAVCLT